MTETTRLLRSSAALALLACLAASPGLAQEEPPAIEEAHLFFELNDTDGDLGIHALIDADAWRWLLILGPAPGERLLAVGARGRLTEQGLTEFAFESDEPSFDELDPEEFFERFPADTYRVLARTLDGETLEETTELTQVIPAPPGNVFVNDEPLDEDCEDEDTPEVSEPVLISWDAVTTRHPDLGDQPGSDDITIIRYQLVVEFETEDDEGNEVVLVYSLDVLPDDADGFEISVPPEFLAVGDEFKYEILVREASFNQTAIESCFELAGDDADDVGDEAE